MAISFVMGAPEAGPLCTIQGAVQVHGTRYMMFSIQIDFWNCTLITLKRFD